MLKRIQLESNVRCFGRASTGSLNRQLFRTGESISAGAHVCVDLPVTMVYDHRELFAVPYQFAGTEGFLLYDEVKESLPPSYRLDVKLFVVK